MNIKDKIKKLLALSTSPNENEAKAALLKAHELMAANKMTEEDFDINECRLVHTKVDGVKWTTDSGDIWMVDLCKVIAEHYFCATAWITTKGTRTHTLEITGMEKDADVSVEIIKYAVGFVKSSIRYLIRKGTCTEAESKCYARGFIEGLTMAYNEQDEDHKEWGLVVNTPKEVEDYKNSLGSKSVRTKKEHSNALVTLMGLNDGMGFSPNKIIKEGDK